MNKSPALLALIALLGSACGRAALPAALAEGRHQTLPSHTPGLVQTSQATGPVDGSQTLTLRVQLPVNDPQDLETFLAALYDPQSPQFHQYLSPQEFRERFYPSADDLKSLRQSLEDAGFETAAVPQGGFLAARVQAHQAERFFNTRLVNYVTADGTRFYAPNSAVSAPAGLPIAGVLGIHSAPPERFYAQPQTAVPSVGNNAAMQLALSPNDIRNAYDIPPSARGAGQQVALVELDGFDMNDLLRYESTYKLPNVPVTTVLLDGASGAPGGGAVEVNLDLDVMVAMAPDLAGIRLIEAPNSLAGFLDTFNECANPSQPDKFLPAVISCSWGSPETNRSMQDVQSYAQVFQQLAAQGQTVFVASGDAGAKADQQTLGVQDPSSQPYAMGVGGTTLAANLALSTGAYTSESAWAGSGGGVSQYWAAPAYQQGVVSANALSSASMRNVPDVSLNADPNTGYVIVSGGRSGVVGGTSAAAPLWTAYIALVNAQRATTGLEPLGWLGPVLYTLGRSPRYGANFHDVADSSTNGFYPAVTGFDDSTGWGTIQGTAMLQTLSAGFARRTFNAPAGF